ncbi:MAG: hypothetical protein ACTHNU_04305 [Gaiellales bacterium]
MTLLDLFGLAFHLSGVLVAGIVYWRFRHRLHGASWGGSADDGDDHGSDRLPMPLEPPWSWDRRPRNPGPHPVRMPRGPRAPSRGPVASRVR